MIRHVLLCVLLAGAATAVRAADLVADAAFVSRDVELLVSRVIAHRFAGDGPALEHALAALQAYDEARHARGAVPSGLVDDARYLAASAAPTRDAQRAALEALLDAKPDDYIRHLSAYRLKHDDAAAATELLADDRHNRRAALFNDAVRPLGVFSGTALLAAINPLLAAGSAVDSVITTAVNLWNYNRLTSREREALVRYRALLGREPATQDAPEIAHAIRRLGAKRLAALCRDTVQLGTRALKDDDIDRAQYYMESAARLEGCDDAPTALRDKVAHALAQRSVREETLRWPADEPIFPASDAEARDLSELLTVTASGNGAAMMPVAQRFVQRHQDSEALPAARFAVAVARDLAGHPDDARRELGEVAKSDSAVGQRIRALLANPTFSQLDALSAAERHHARDVARYVLLGTDVSGRSALYSATQLGAEGAQAAQSLGIVNVLGVFTRAWQAWRKDPASNQAIIDRGEELLAREPRYARAGEVHERLSEAYERAENYGRALMHYRATSVRSPTRIGELEEKLADQLLRKATATHDPRLLNLITVQLPATPAADKAREALRTRADEGEMSLTRAQLLAHPTLIGPGGFDLDPRLFDDERSNGELADAGITIVHGGLRLTVQDARGKETHTENHPLGVVEYTRALAAAQEVLYAEQIQADARAPESGRFERYIPFFLQGGIGESGISVYPGIKMRRYQSDDPDLYD